jgi:hypothetical protein
MNLSDLVDVITGNVSILSAITLVIMGAFLAYYFDKLKIKNTLRKQALQKQEKYNSIFLIEINTFRRQLIDFIKYGEVSWLDNTHHYGKYLLYHFGRIYGWSKLMEENLFCELNESTKKDPNKYIRMVYALQKPLNSRFYYQDIYKQEEIDIYLIPKYYTQAISEIMIIEGKNNNFGFIDFIDFIEKTQDLKYSYWFDSFMQILIDSKKNEYNLPQDILIMVIENLEQFITSQNPELIKSQKEDFNITLYASPSIISIIDKKNSK